jgi:hypothetical protein
MSERDIEISALEVYAMVIARDALIEQLLTLTVGEQLAEIWQQATQEFDSQIRNGLIDNINDETDG